MRLVGADEMRAIERVAIDELGIPATTLMERAGRAAAEGAIELGGNAGRMVVVCGAGNNGGDGFVAARHLHLAGREVVVIALGTPERATPEALAAWKHAEQAGVPVGGLAALQGFPARPGDVVVDAIFGTGPVRPAAGPFADAIDAIGALRERGARVLAVDLPSGVSADTGRPVGPAVRADRTVALGFAKIGLALQPGVELAGTVSVANIGIPAAASDRVPPTAELLDEAAVLALVPPRGREVHKGDAGRLLVVAGSTGKTGCAHLALTGALRGGAGLVTLAARAEVVGPALSGRPEAMSIVLPGTGAIARSDLPALEAALVGANALVIGPGIPRGPETAPAIRALLDRCPIPTVIDADGVNALADHPGLVAVIGHHAPIVLTPHPGEMARLVGGSIEEVQEDRVGIARRKAQEWGAVVVLKGARTVVADPDGPAAIVPTGNPGMATGGTGDVLAGLLGALLAGGLRPREAARAAAWIHGRAGDLAAERFGERGMIAGDLAECIAAVWSAWGR
jgi:ADP-dependent NAD(P)H-hydrate dehydratase / NAD(P)H-hydrate epimerase